MDYLTSFVTLSQGLPQADWKFVDLLSSIIWEKSSGNMFWKCGFPVILLINIPREYRGRTLFRGYTEGVLYSGGIQREYFIPGVYRGSTLFRGYTEGVLYSEGIQRA